MRFLRRLEQRHEDAAETDLYRDFPLCPETAFHDLVGRELRRTSRIGRPFLLVLFDIPGCTSAEMARKVGSVLSSSTRETDTKGWYAEGATVGMLCTEFGGANSINAAEEAIVGRLRQRLSGFCDGRPCGSRRTPCRQALPATGVVHRDGHMANVTFPNSPDHAVLFKQDRDETGG